MLIVVGVILHLVTSYGSVNPRSPVGSPAIIMLGVYLVALPVALWFIEEERTLRFIIFFMWVIYVAFWIVAAYRMRLT